MPEALKSSTLGTVAEVFGGGTPSTAKADYWGGDILWITPTEVVAQDGETVTATGRTITEAGLRHSGAKLLPTGSVLVTSRATVGAVAITGTPIAINQGFAGMVAGPDILPRFLLAWCRAHRAEFISRATGSTFLEVSRSKVKDIPILLPSLSEQRRAVGILDAVEDEERAARTAALDCASARRVLREEMLAAFDAPTKPLGEVVDIQAKLVDPTATEYADLPHIGVERIVSGVGRLTACQSAAEDGVTSGKFHHTDTDVIYSKIRPELRKAAFPERAGLCSADAYPLRPGEAVTARYLLELLLSEGFVQAAIARSSRTKMPKINRRELFAIEVPVPTRAQQDSLTGALSALAAEEEAHTAHAQACASLWTCLAHDLMDAQDDTEPGGSAVTRAGTT